jgi:hypothetical protein
MRVAALPALLWLLVLATGPLAGCLEFAGNKLPQKAEWTVNELSTAQQVLLLNVEKRVNDGAAAGPDSAARKNGSPLSSLLVLYYSRHFGTVQDFAFVAKSLGLNWSHLTPDQVCWSYYSGVEKTEECYEKLRYVCDVFDVIFVGDIIPDGFPLLAGGGCKSWIVFQMTNRFDWDVRERERYYRFVNDSAQNNPRVLFMANNPLEIAYARSVGVHIPLSKYYLARPTGYSPLKGSRRARRSAPAAARPAPAAWTSCC